MEKVVERIVLMPQVHEVSKHIYDVQEEANPGVAVDVEFTEHELTYKKKYGKVKANMDNLTVELRSMQKTHPELADKLKSVENYMTDLDEVIAHPKIVQVNKEKIVEKKVAEPVVLQSGVRTRANERDEAFYLVMM